ncbi:peroxisomal short-chain alcohol dehydrogenase [Fusarium pseudocircinatum]|uniref:Peroxisomal short-chain alcohol dehydrogenase n=1 Tax=Fusarium pseudocircinatum TaxID=56676 RepID=A0A8H5PU89_9HYPO|nr:peroxisomal short-chain alcohol dehydrogenase [Fusarium pseudocircinatum]
MEFKVTSLIERTHKRAYDAILPTRPELSQSGKTILITGGTAGIAYAVARNFGLAGAEKVIITGRSEQKLNSAVKGLIDEAKAINPKSQTKYEGRLCQIAETSSIDALFDGFRKDNIHIDVLVLSAALIVPGKITDQTWEGVWGQFQVNVRATHQFRDLFEKQPRTGAGTRYIINISTSAIHHESGGIPVAAYTLTKNSAALLLQKIADETDPSKTQIINFHPGAILSLSPREYGLTEDSADWDHEDLPGSFAVWAASPEAAFLHGRFVWATWDVEELKSGLLHEKLGNDDSLLKVTVKGL